MNKSRARSLNVVLTFLASAANILVVSLQALILTPLYLRTFGLNSYGAWLGTGDLLLWLQAMDFGISNFAIQKMSTAHGRDDFQDLMSWFSSTLLMLTFLGFLAAVIAWASSAFIFQPFNLSAEAAAQLISAFRIAGVSLGLTLVNFAFAGFARAMQDPWWINGFTLLGSVTGFAVSYFSLRAGAGVHAIAYGMLARSSVILLGGLAFVSVSWQQFQAVSKQPQLNYLRESLTIAPYSMLGSLGYAASNQSENAVLSYIVSPELAATYNTMKKFGDMGRSLLETLTYATFAPYASEYAEDPRAAAGTYSRILQTHAVLAILLCIFLLFFNRPLLDWWVGHEIYLGHTVNALLALQIYSVTRAYLLNSLDRAMRPPQFAYLFLIGEAVMKLLLLLGMVRFAGVIAVPATASLVALLSLIYFRWRHQRFLGSRDPWGLTLFVALATVAAFTVQPALGLLLGLAACALALMSLRRKRSI